MVGVIRVKPQLGENSHGIIPFMWSYKELVNLRWSSWIFHLRFCVLRFQSTNSNVVELFLDEFQVGF